ncbi:MAG: GGDEF domain-containing protein [Magnetococcus sp. THC-1_WYH]
MGICVSLSSRKTPEIDPALFARHPTDLQEELEDYKRETIRLSRVYELNRKLGETLDLDSMLGVFSRWVSRKIDHELVALRHSGCPRTPMACSCHGPYRQKLVDAATRLFENSMDQEILNQLERLGLVAQRWILDREGNDCLLMIHREDSLAEYGHLQEVEAVLGDLRGPLERALVYENLYDQARKDALTGLVNRRVFMERAEQERIKADRYHCPLVLACLDLDYFKEINDSLGHGEGDLVLKKVSQTFLGMIRDADLLARTGGDEFALILPNTTLANAGMLMTRICDKVRELNIVASTSTVLGVSIGLAPWEKHDDLSQWWEKADAALYRAKAGGRSQVSL